MSMDTARPRILLMATLIALAHAVPALADCKGESSECVPVGGWNFSLALGAGVRTDPVVHEGTIPLVVIPQFSYYGEHFFIDDLDAGVTFLDSDRTTLSLIASPGYDRVFFYRSDPQNIFVTGLGNFNSGTGTPGAGQVPAGSAGNGSGQPPPGTTGLITSTKFPPRSRQWTRAAPSARADRHAGKSAARAAAFRT